MYMPTVLHAPRRRARQHRQGSCGTAQSDRQGHRSLLVLVYGDVGWAFKRRETPMAFLLPAQWYHLGEVRIDEADGLYQRGPEAQPVASRGLSSTSPVRYQEVGTAAMCYAA